MSTLPYRGPFPENSLPHDERREERRKDREGSREKREEGGGFRSKLCVRLSTFSVLNPNCVTVTQNSIIPGDMIRPGAGQEVVGIVHKTFSMLSILGQLCMFDTEHLKILRQYCIWACICSRDMWPYYTHMHFSIGSLTYISRILSEIDRKVRCGLISACIWALGCA